MMFDRLTPVVLRMPCSRSKQVLVSFIRSCRSSFGRTHCPVAMRSAHLIARAAGRVPLRWASDLSLSVTAFVDVNRLEWTMRRASLLTMRSWFGVFAVGPAVQF